MANITIKELLAADKVSELVDKINFNFDQLLLNGGGPLGLKGGPGIQGPIGARGTIWFTAHDLWTTSDSPSWTGTPVKANNPLVAGYPQFKGDPNRFRPAAPIGVSALPPYVFPEHTYTFSVPIKPVRGGDLFLQEADDTFDSQSSKDGDIWEYSASTLKWIYTGVNIKGNTGSSGANAFSEWIRISSGIDDIIYPKHVIGQDTTRLLLGQYSDIFKMDNSTSILTINTDLTHIALNNPNIHSQLINPGNEELGATIQVVGDGTLVIQGSNVSGIGLSRQVVISSFDEDMIIQSGGPNFLELRQKPANSKHVFSGGSIEVNHINTSGLKQVEYITSTGPSTAHRLKQEFVPTQGVIGISTEATGYGGLANYINAPHLILQKEVTSLFKNVGIGYFPSPNVPGSKLSISGSLAVGQGYATLVSPDQNGAIIQGRVGIGTATFPANSGHKVQVNGSILIGSVNEIIGDNVYYDFASGGFKPIYGTSGAGLASWFIKQQPTSIDSDAQVIFNVFPITEPGSGSGTNPLSNPSASNAITIRQSKNTGLGKIGLNISGFATDSRLTINDTDQSGLHFIRFGNLVGGNDFYGGLNTGARIWHSALAYTTSGTDLVDGRFNIYQFNQKDLVIGTKTDTFPTNGTHHRIVIKKESGFIGINTLRPKHTFTIKGRDYISEPDLYAPMLFDSIFDPDEVNMGTFEDTSIFGLNVNTEPIGGGLNNDVNIQGASYIGFNAWFSNPATSFGVNGPAVVYGRHEDDPDNAAAGAIFFADRNGNFHWANYESNVFNP